jgi:hypothetical protein
MYKKYSNHILFVTVVLLWIASLSGIAFSELKDQENARKFVAEKQKIEQQIEEIEKVNSEIVEIEKIVYDENFGSYYAIATGWAVDLETSNFTSEMLLADEIEIFYDENDEITGFELQ